MHIFYKDYIIDLIEIQSRRNVSILLRLSRRLNRNPIGTVGANVIKIRPTV